ncbi:VTT domain-containing protein [Thiolapillus sp.]
MAESFQQLLAWVSANPNWAGAIVFLMAFAESLAVVGMVVPGVAVMFAVGALIGAGALDFQVMVLWAVLGAVAGDGLSFWLGKRYQRQLTALWPFNKHPAMLEKGVAFFQRYGGKSVAIGRFFGPVRAVIPLVAGMMNMSAGAFLLANVGSALVWAPAYLLPGMAFGASMELASEVALRLVILLVVLLASLWFLAWLSHRLFLFIQPHSKQLVQKLLGFGERHHHLRHIVRALGDPGHPESAGLAMLAGLLVLASLLLGIIALLPAAPLLVADNALHLGLKALANPVGDHIMLALSAMAGKAATLAMLLVVALVLWIANHRRATRHWLAGCGSVWLLGIGLEALLRHSPSLMAVMPDVFVLRATVFFGMAAVLVATPLPHPRRWRIYSTATVLVMAVMLAQLYLGSSLLAVLHALGGGIIWTTAVGMAYRTHVQDHPIAGRLALITGLSVILLGAASALGVNAPPPRPLALEIQGSMSLQEWRNGGWRKLPAWRSDILERKDRPLNLQYAGPMKTLLARMEQQGWRKAVPAHGLEWLKMLAAGSDLQELPLLPHSHDGRMSSLVMTRPAAEQRREVVYFWAGTWLVEETGQPIWLGEAILQERKQWLGLLAWPRDSRNGQTVLNRLKKDLAAPELGQHEVMDGRLLLVWRRSPLIEHQ